MEILNFIGYYEGFDAINIANLSADEIIKRWKNGDEAFHFATFSKEGVRVDQYISTEPYLIGCRYSYQYTTDGEYIVKYDVLDYTEEEINELSSEDLECECITIYEVLEASKPKPYKLICINENYEVLSFNEFHTYEDAHNQMEREHNTFVEDIKDDDNYILSNVCNKYNAHVIYGPDHKHIWNIVKNYKLVDKVLFDLVFNGQVYNDMVLDFGGDVDEYDIHREDGPWCLLDIGNGVYDFEVYDDPIRDEYGNFTPSGNVSVGNMWRTTEEDGYYYPASLVDEWDYEITNVRVKFIND